VSAPDFSGFDRLEELTRDLGALRLELGEVMATAREQRIRAFQDSGEESVSASDRYADGACLDLDLDIIRLKADIASAETEWEFLMGWMAATAGV
jgi:hypothetical protein